MMTGKQKLKKLSGLPASSSASSTTNLERSHHELTLRVCGNVTQINSLHYSMVLKVTLCICKLQQFYWKMVPTIKILLLCRVINWRFCLLPNIKLTNLWKTKIRHLFIPICKFAMVQSSHSRQLSCSGQYSSPLLSHDIKYEGIKSEHIFKLKICTTILQPSTERTKQSNITQSLHQKLQFTARWIPFKNNTKLQQTYVLNFNHEPKILGHPPVSWETNKTYNTTFHNIVSWIKWWLYDQSVHNITLYWLTVEWHYTNQLLATWHGWHRITVTHHKSKYFSKKLQL